MAILDFQIPQNVVQSKEEELKDGALFARFELAPLEPGYATTIGNALRRVLLSSLEGYAIASVRIEGVQQEFATIPGVTEDVTNIILNLKQVRFTRVLEDTDEETVTFAFSGKEVIKAGDLNRNLTAFKVRNTDLEICHLTKDTNLELTLRINKGRGYVPADQNRREKDEINTIAIDSIYTPIVNVNFKQEDFRVEGRTDYNKLLLEITTDGTIHTRDALTAASQTLIKLFNICAQDVVERAPGEDNAEEINEKNLRIRRILKTELSEYNLSSRAQNCLKSGDVVTVGDLLKHTPEELLKFRNFGDKSLKETDALVEMLAQEDPDFQYGMDVAKYKQ